MTNRRGRKAPALDCRLRPVLSGACLIGLTQPGLDALRGSGAAERPYQQASPLKTATRPPIGAAQSGIRGIAGRGVTVGVKLSCRPMTGPSAPRPG